MQPDDSRVFIQHCADVTVVTFNDTEILEEGAIRALEEAIMPVVQEPRCQDMLLDFSNVRFMSSAFLGLLVKIHKRTCERGGHLELRNIHPEIYKVFEITQLNRIFDIS